MSASVLMVGWHPDAVDWSKWPDLTHEKLTAGLKAQREGLQAKGYDAEWALIHEGDAGAELMEKMLKERRYDVVLIGAGVRKDDDHFLLFERLINIIHEHAPDARIAFNTQPSDTQDAISRWS